MINPTELAQNSSGAIVEQTAAYFRNATEALVVGGKVLDHAVSLHQLGAELEGTTENPDNSALYPAAVQLAEVARQSLGMLHDLKVAGLINMAEGDDPFELVAPASLALNAGETDDSNEDGGDNADANGAGDSNPNPETELTEIRQRQEKVLTDVFGKELQAEISSLKEEEMPFFGQAVKALYMSAKVTGRGASVKEDRAEQFEAVLSGFDDEELKNEYGEPATKILASLERAATVTMPKTYEPKYLQVTFGQVRKQYQELNAAPATA